MNIWVGPTLSAIKHIKSQRSWLFMSQNVTILLSSTNLLDTTTEDMKIIRYYKHEHHDFKNVYCEECYRNIFLHEQTCRAMFVLLSWLFLLVFLGFADRNGDQSKEKLTKSEESFSFLIGTVYHTTCWCTDLVAWLFTYSDNCHQTW